MSGGAMDSYSVNGWEQFQHYKDRNPPWVKLHGKTLTSPTWLKGTDRQRMVQIASILLAARYDNTIPLDMEILRPVAGLKCTDAEFFDAIEYLEKSDFITISRRKHAASNEIAKCSPSRVEDIDQGEKTPIIPKLDARGKRARVPRTRLSDDWKPTSADRDYAVSRGLTDAEIDLEAQAFRRYWTGPDAAKGGLKADWHRTWCNRIDDVADRIIGRRPKDRQPPSHTEQSGHRQTTRAEHLAHYSSFKRLGMWLPAWGPRPGEPGCQVPVEVIAEVDAEAMAPA